ncbi:ribosome-binding protein 1 [Plakobranchus ocellatus]|uniref:Ribosome-binding protein 1 n=1 Tax=Plakobranchus ocellatus TaxID=259542 RepID=A0AAV4CTN2_9GAST|nr:ribosome-binding protein 1 [Plakobranchus ocellatus]
MEVVTILIGVAVFIGSALMIYCISAVSMKEKTFEEAIAEQREREEKEREKAKADKKAEKGVVKKTSYKKGKQEKVKEKVTPVVEPELKAEHKMVNLEIEPEIIEASEAGVLGAGIRQRSGKKEKVKSILVNKDEPPLIAPKQVELIHKPIVPKDEMELKKSHEKHAEKKESPVKENKAKVVTEIKENLPPKPVINLKEDLKLKQRDEEKHAPKSKPPQGDAPLNGTRLVSAVKSAKLSDDEVQSLIDILLNRQGLTPTAPIASESWNKKSQKGDPVSTMKKQLEEKEKLLQEERNNSVGLMSRAKEMKNELTSERSKIVSLEKRYQEQLGRQQAELEALKARMQHTHEQHLLETNNLQARLHQAEAGGDRVAAQKLNEENKVLQESLTLKSKETVALGEKMKQMERDLNASFNKVKGLESKTSSYEDKIRKLEAAQKETEFVASQRVEEVTHELRKTESMNASLTTDVQNATGALSTAQKEVNLLKAKLQELESHLTEVDANKGSELKLQESERKCSDLEKNVKNLEKQISDLSQRLDGSSTEISQLQQENKSLIDANKAMQEKLQNTQSSPSNGSLHEDNLTISVDEHERIMTEKSKEVSDLSSGLEGQKKTISDLQTKLNVQSAKVEDLETQLASQKAKNDDLRSKNWKAMEALEKTEQSSSEKVEKALKSARQLESKEVSELSSGLERQKKTISDLQTKLAVQSAKVEDLETQLANQRAKNDDLRSKNWKAMEALEKTEQSSSEKVEKALKSARELSSSIESHDKLAFQGLFPDIKVSEKLPHKEWVTTFQKQAEKNLSSLKTPEKVQQLEEQNKKVKAKLADYEKQISDLESKVSVLQQVEEENKQLKSSQSPATPVDSEQYSQLEAENKTLQSELDHYRTIVSDTESKLRQLEKSIDEEEKKWHDKLRQAKAEGQKGAESSEKISELESQLSAQKAQVQEYRSVLSHTESILKELEEKIGAEEKVWQTKLAEAEKELAQTKQQLENLKQEVSVSQGSQEMKARIEELENEVKDAEQRIESITEEKEKIAAELSEAQKPASSDETRNPSQELDELRTQLEAERKKSKDLSLNIVKLNGIIKTGQDALTQEQGNVKKLQESLDSKSMSSGISDIEESEQAASSNENGTSV